MKKRSFVISIWCLLCIVWVSSIVAQEKKTKDAESKSRLTSQKLDEDSKSLDRQIFDYSKKIETAVAKYELLNLKDIKILPYQVSYDMGKDFIKVEKHIFVRTGFAGAIVGLKRKTLIIYFTGKSVSKFETEIYEKNYDASKNILVKIVDNSPTTMGTDDLKFTHIVNDRVLFKDKSMSEIRNTTAFPVKNDLKREFYVPHLSYFYGLVVNIAETYLKNLKDSDESMTQFLRKSTQY